MKDERREKRVVEENSRMRAEEEQGKKLRWQEKCGGACMGTCFVGW